MSKQCNFTYLSSYLYLCKNSLGNILSTQVTCNTDNLSICWTWAKNKTYFLTLVSKETKDLLLKNNLNILMYNVVLGSVWSTRSSHQSSYFEKTVSAHNPPEIRDYFNISVCVWMKNWQSTCWQASEVLVDVFVAVLCGYSNANFDQSVCYSVCPLAQPKNLSKYRMDCNGLMAFMFPGKWIVRTLMIFLTFLINMRLTFVSLNYCKYLNYFNKLWWTFSSVTIIMSSLDCPIQSTSIVNTLNQDSGHGKQCTLFACFYRLCLCKRGSSTAHRAASMAAAS